jgi:hypothetical protein
MDAVVWLKLPNFLAKSTMSNQHFVSEYYYDEDVSDCSTEDKGSADFSSFLDGLGILNDQAHPAEAALFITLTLNSKALRQASFAEDRLGSGKLPNCEDCTHDHVRSGV